MRCTNLQGLLPLLLSCRHRRANPCCQNRVQDNSEILAENCKVFFLNLPVFTDRLLTFTDLLEQSDDRLFSRAVCSL